MKVGLAVSLASVLFARHGTAPVVGIDVPFDDLHWFGLALLIGREVVVGVVLGFLMSLFLLPMRIAGAYIAQEMGFSLATLADPTQQASTSVVSLLFESLGVLMFFLLDIHHVLLAFLNLTLTRLPFGRSLPHGLNEPVIRGLTNSIQQGLVLAAPMGICLMATVVALAFLTKVSPQMNLFSVGLATRVAVGLLAGVAFLPDLCLLMRRVFPMLPVS